MDLILKRFLGCTSWKSFTKSGEFTTIEICFSTCSTYHCILVYSYSHHISLCKGIF